ncbi:MAG: glycoside hydrolase domain-containing protein, partial [Armatimonadota bacterium]
AAENDRDWMCADRNQAQELTPVDGNGTIWRYHFVDTAVTRNMATPLNITFCWQATPVKPVDNWYAKRCTVSAMYGMNVADAYNNGIRQMHIHEPWTEVMGYPWTNNNQAQITSLINGFKSYGMNLAQYAQNAISDAAPDYEQYGGEWGVETQIAPWFSRGPSSGTPGMLMQNVSQGSHVASWADYYLYYWNNMISQWGSNGVYCDGINQPMLNWNRYYPNVYTVGGVIRPTRTIFDARNFMMRFYKMAKGLDPTFFFLGHMDTYWFMPTAGFLDFGMGGEILMNYPAGFETPWSYWRAANTGRQFGVEREFLPTSIVAEGYAIPLALVHGTSVLGIGWGSGVTTYQAPIWNMWNTFGIDQATFVPYWQNSPYVTSSNPDVKATYFQKPGQILLAVATNKRQTPTATITINLTALGLPANPAVDAGLNGPIAHNPPVNGILTLSFPSQTNNGGYVWIY